MKTTVIRYLIVLGAIILVWPDVSFAQANPSAVQALEFSLRSLYDSANEVDKKNKWLSDEIARMNQESIFLSEELKSLESEKAKQTVDTAVNEEGVLKSMPWEEERANMMIEDLDDLNKEETYLKDRLEGKNNDQKEIEQSVVSMQKEAAQMNKEMAQLKEKLQKPPENKDFIRLKETLARSGRNLVYAQKKYDRLEKEFGGPVKVFKESTVKNKELTAKVAFLQKQLESARERHGQLTQAMDALQNDAQSMALNNDIESLQAQRKELADALHLAENKLGKDFTIPNYTDELKGVKEDIEVIRGENQELKDKLNQLEKKIRPTENK